MKIKIFLSVFITSSLLAQYNPSQEKALICGVGKNVAQYLPRMIQSIESLAAQFKDYRIIIYENNSSDQTPKLLREWMQRNPKVIVFSEHVSNDMLLQRVKGKALRDQAPCRMELIAYARNKVLEEAMKNKYDDYSFVIMTDLDFARGWEVNNVLQTFKIKTPWDCIAANGIVGRGEHYDRYAFRDDQYPLGPELTGEDFWVDASKKLYLNPNSGLKKVYSAFGGLAIYKRSSLKPATYSGFVTADLEKLMDRILNQEIPKNHHQCLIYKRTIGANESDTTLPITFQPNCGYDGPVCCEHATLHATMILKGYDKIYVDPNLICRY